MVIASLCCLNGRTSGSISAISTRRISLAETLMPLTIAGILHLMDSTGVTPLLKRTNSRYSTWRMPSGANRTVHYIAYMHRRIAAINQVLANTGSILVHVDGRTAHLLRLSLDLIFGREHFINQIVWHYGLGGFGATRHLPRKHDIIMWYAKSDDYTFNQQRGSITPAMRARYNQQDARGRYFVQGGKRYYQQGGKPWDDVWEIPTIAQTAKERTGYPTQKPLELLRRIVLLASSEGDLVLDAFCGSGTTLVVAASLGRRCLGIDIGAEACHIAERRLAGAHQRAAQTALVLPPADNSSLVESRLSSEIPFAEALDSPPRGNG